MQIRKELHSRPERLRIYLMGVPLDSQVVAAIRFGREDESLCAQALREFADAAIKGAQVPSPEGKNDRMKTMSACQRINRCKHPTYCRSEGRRERG
jgi:hypothetical protein